MVWSAYWLAVLTFFYLTHIGEPPTPTTHTVSPPHPGGLHSKSSSCLQTNLPYSVRFQNNHISHTPCLSAFPSSSRLFPLPLLGPTLPWHFVCPYLRKKTTTGHSLTIDKVTQLETRVVPWEGCVMHTQRIWECSKFRHHFLSPADAPFSSGGLQASHFSTTARNAARRLLWAPSSSKMDWCNGNAGKWTE